MIWLIVFEQNLLSTKQNYFLLCIEVCRSHELSHTWVQHTFHIEHGNSSMHDLRFDTTNYFETAYERKIEVAFYNSRFSK